MNRTVRLMLAVAAIFAVTMATKPSIAVAGDEVIKLSFKNDLWSFSGRVYLDAEAKADYVKVGAHYSCYLRFRPAGKKVFKDDGKLFSVKIAKGDFNESYKYGPLTFDVNVGLKKKAVRVTVKTRLNGSYLGRKVSIDLGSHTKTIGL